MFGKRGKDFFPTWSEVDKSFWWEFTIGNLSLRIVCIRLSKKNMRLVIGLLTGHYKPILHLFRIVDRIQQVDSMMTRMNHQNKFWKALIYQRRKYLFEYQMFCQETVLFDTLRLAGDIMWISYKVWEEYNPPYNRSTIALIHENK